MLNAKSSSLTGAPLSEIWCSPSPNTILSFRANFKFVPVTVSPSLTCSWLTMIFELFSSYLTPLKSTVFPLLIIVSGPSLTPFVVAIQSLLALSSAYPTASCNCASVAARSEPAYCSWCSASHTVLSKPTIVLIVCSCASISLLILISPNSACPLVPFMEIALPISTVPFAPSKTICLVSSSPSTTLSFKSNFKFVPVMTSPSSVFSLTCSWLTVIFELVSSYFAPL